MGSKDTMIEGDDKKPNEYFSSRYTLAYVASFGFFMTFMVRVNLSVALVAMVNTTQTDVTTSSNDCPNLSQNGTGTLNENVGEFQWNPEIQGIILASFYYGYVILQIPGGWLAGKIGGKWIVGSSVLVMSLLTLLTPLAAKHSVGLLLATRVVMGLFGGIIYPGMHAMLGKWSPVWERTKLSAITYSGTIIGIVVAFPLTGVLCQYGFAGGWPSVFYVIGMPGCVWFVLWSVLAYNNPEEHPRISQEEKDYINKSIGQCVSKQSGDTPWRSILTSGPVWAILVSGTCQNWGYYTLLSGLPTYMKEILKLDITQIGFLSGMPYLACFIMYCGAAFLSDFIRERHYLTTTHTRKLMILIGATGPALCLVLVNFVGCNRVAVISLLVVGVCLDGVCEACLDVNHIDLAPNYAGVIIGVCNSCENLLAGIAAPIVIGLLIKEKQNRETWGQVFYITAAIYMFGVIFYLIFGSGKLQPWATPVDRTDIGTRSDDLTPLLTDNESSKKTNNSLSMALYNTER